MKKTMLLGLCSLAIVGCLGYSSRDGELIGQAKKVTHVTPLICSDYYAVDVSLGVMQNGVGSMSTQDVWLTLTDTASLDAITKAVAQGAIVKVKYDEPRCPICTEDYILTSFEVVK